MESDFRECAIAFDARIQSRRFPSDHPPTAAY
jgi:hypothetical protein